MDLSGTLLRGANLYRVVGTNANFTNLDLTESSFRFATLTNATFAGAIVKSVDFSSNGLTPIVSPAQLYSTSSYATGNLSGINLSNFSNGGGIWDFRGKDLTNADLFNTSQSATFTGATINGALIGPVGFAQLSSAASYVSGDLSRVNFADTVVTSFNFSGKSLIGADFSGVSISSTSFANANLSNANLSGATLTISDTLTNTNFSGARLHSATLRSLTATSITFAGANLAKADFSNSVLPGVNFSGANLTGASLASVTFTGANLSNTDLTNANFGLAERRKFSGQSYERQFIGHVIEGGEYRHGHADQRHVCRSFGGGCKSFLSDGAWFDGEPTLQHRQLHHWKFGKH